jgi:16S rRNA (cytosine1402-N4)-methyltransferase
MVYPQFPHCPILINEFLDIFSGRKLNVFIDGTLGAGGHAEAILMAHPEIQLFIGMDQDPVALDIASRRLKQHGEKVRCVLANFQEMKETLSFLSPQYADGIFLDLGVSSMQLDQPERGMSFSKEGPLDMRMSPSGDVTAELILNTWSEEALGEIFREYGEEPKWRAAARVIVAARDKQPLKTTFDLVKVLRPVLYRKSRKQINPLTLVFQALRIAVNDELNALSKTLPDCISILSPKGRLGVITFHSLEDRIVKNLFRGASGYRGGRSEGLDLPDSLPEPLVRIITKKPMIPSAEEMNANSRSRSAKMRVIEKI